MNLLSLINSSLAYIYCSTTLSNHELIRLNDSSQELIYIYAINLISIKHPYPNNCNGTVSSNLIYSVISVVKAGSHARSHVQWDEACSFNTSAPRLRRSINPPVPTTPSKQRTIVWTVAACSDLGFLPAAQELPGQSEPAQETSMKLSNAVAMLQLG
jgi:hypothetical protein